MQDCIPFCQLWKQLCKRANEWKKFEEKYRNIEEELDDFGSYEEEEISEELDNDMEEEIEAEEVPVETEGSRALVKQFDPLEIFEKSLPLIKKKNLILDNQIRKMEYQKKGKKVSDWLKNNFRNMDGDTSSASWGNNISGHFRMANFSSSFMEMESNNSTTSVDGAEYILANKNKRSQRTHHMTINEYCYQDAHQWAPVEIRQRPLSVEFTRQPLALESSRQPLAPLAIEYSKLLQENSTQDQRKDGQKATRKRTRFCAFECSTSDSSESDEEREWVQQKMKLPKMARSTRKIFDSDSSTSSKENKSDSPKDSPKRRPKSAQQIVIYSPKQCQVSQKNIRITMEMLAEKIGWKMAREMKNDFYLRHTIPTSSTLIFDIFERRFTQISNTKSPASPIKSPEELKEATDMSPQRDIVIYAPPPDRDSYIKTKIQPCKEFPYLHKSQIQVLLISAHLSIKIPYYSHRHMTSYR
uniref:Uncharacterized protein n=1 Tax=Phlebotomus papatasi TaxID=29031 RepID=A0A1B0DLJ2_PHLPP